MLRPETNIRNIDRSALKQRSSVKIPKDAPRHERMAELMRQIGKLSSQVRQKICLGER